MKNSVLFFLLIQFFALSSAGQNWEGIGDFNGYADHFAVDSINDVLYIAGGFNKINGSLNVQGVCKYDGNQITPVNESAELPDFGNEFMTIQDMVVYDGYLYVASYDFKNYGSIEGTPISSQIVRFDGEQWESVFPEVMNCEAFRVLDEKLYIFSYWGGLSEDSHIVRVFDGEESIDFQYEPPYIEYSNGNLGYFNDILSIDSGFVLVGDMSYTLFNDEPVFYYYGKDVFYWDGESVVNTLFNEGLNAFSGSTNNNEIRRILRFQDEIYIGGWIKIFGNSEGRGVLRKGDNGVWYALSGNPGSGPSPWVEDMLVHNDLMWIVGKLLEYEAEDMQDEPMYLSNILLWDGENAFRPSNDVFPDPSFLYDITVFRDTIYVAGNFQFINVAPISSVARFIGNLDETMVNVPVYFEPIINVHPNPCTTHFYLKFQQETSQPRDMVIYTLTGQQVIAKQLSGNQRQTIDVSGLDAGMYVVQLTENGQPAGTSKLVVQGR